MRKVIHQYFFYILESMHGGALRLDLESEGESILHCYVIYWSGSEENLKKFLFYHTFSCLLWMLEKKLT